jgi:hypothetical protein
MGMRIAAGTRATGFWLGFITAFVVMVLPEADMRPNLRGELVIASAPLLGINHKANRIRSAKWDKSNWLAIAKVAVQLARSEASHIYTAAQIGRDACDLVIAAQDARAALERGRCPEQHYAAVRSVAQRYGAETVARGDVLGLVVGLIMHHGRHTSGFENIVHIA